MNRLNQTLEWIIIFLISVMLFSVLWGVCSRYILANQSSWTDELARFMLIWVSVLGAVYVSGKNAHITIDLLPQSMSKRSKIRLDIITSFIILAFVAAVFIVGGGRYVFVSFKLEQTSAALGVPVGFVYLVLPLAGLTIVWYKLMYIKQRITSLKNVS